MIEEPEQRSSLLSALLSPEIVRRRVRDVFRIQIPSPAIVEPEPVIRTPRPKLATRVRPLAKLAETRPSPSTTRRPTQSKPAPKPTPKPVHIPVTRHPTMADYSSIAGFHLKFSVHPNKQYAHIQMNSIYGDLFESQRPALQKQNSSPSTSIVVCGTGNMMESRVTQLWFYQSHLLLTKDMYKILL